MNIVGGIIGGMVGSITEHDLHAFTIAALLCAVAVSVWHWRQRAQLSTSQKAIKL